MAQRLVWAAKQALGKAALGPRLPRTEDMRVSIWMQRYLANSPFRHGNPHSTGDPNLNQQTLRTVKILVKQKHSQEGEDYTCSVQVLIKQLTGVDQLSDKC